MLQWFIKIALIFLLAKVVKKAGKFNFLPTKLGHPEVLLLPDPNSVNLKPTLSSLLQEK
jgi:hypothetical protein